MLSHRRKLTTKLLLKKQKISKTTFFSSSRNKKTNLPLTKKEHKESFFSSHISTLPTSNPLPTRHNNGITRFYPPLLTRKTRFFSTGPPNDPSLPTPKPSAEDATIPNYAIHSNERFNTHGGGKYYYSAHRDMEKIFPHTQNGFNQQPHHAFSWDWLTTPMTTQDGTPGARPLAVFLVFGAFFGFMAYQLLKEPRLDGYYRHAYKLIELENPSQSLGSNGGGGLFRIIHHFSNLNTLFGSKLTQFEYDHNLYGPQLLQREPKLSLSLRGRSSKEICMDEEEIRKFCIHHAAIISHQLRFLEKSFYQHKLPQFCYIEPFEQHGRKCGKENAVMRGFLGEIFAPIFYYFPHLGFVPSGMASHLADVDLNRRREYMQHYPLYVNMLRVQEDLGYVVRTVLREDGGGMGKDVDDKNDERKDGETDGEKGMNNYSDNFQNNDEVINIQNNNKNKTTPLSHSHLVDILPELLSKLDTARTYTNNLYQSIYNAKLWENSTNESIWWKNNQELNQFQKKIITIEQNLEKCSPSFTTFQKKQQFQHIKSNNKFKNTNTIQNDVIKSSGIQQLLLKDRSTGYIGSAEPIIDSYRFNMNNPFDHELLLLKRLLCRGPCEVEERTSFESTHFDPQYPPQTSADGSDSTYTDDNYGSEGVPYLWPFHHNIVFPLGRQQVDVNINNLLQQNHYEYQQIFSSYYEFIVSDGEKLWSMEEINDRNNNLYFGNKNGEKSKNFKMNFISNNSIDNPNSNYSYDNNEDGFNGYSSNNLNKNSFKPYYNNYSKKLEFLYPKSHFEKNLIFPPENKYIDLIGLINEYNNLNVTADVLVNSKHILAMEVDGNDFGGGYYGGDEQQNENNNNNNNKNDYENNFFQSNDETNTQNDVYNQMNKSTSVLSLSAAQKWTKVFVGSNSNNNINAYDNSKKETCENKNVLNPFYSRNLLSLPDIPTY